MNPRFPILSNLNKFLRVLGLIFLIIGGSGVLFFKDNLLIVISSIFICLIGLLLGFFGEVFGILCSIENNTKTSSDSLEQLNKNFLIYLKENRKNGNIENFGIEDISKTNYDSYSTRNDENEAKIENDNGKLLSIWVPIVLAIILGIATTIGVLLWRWPAN